MNRIFAILLALAALGVVVSGCTQSSGEEGGSTAGAEKKEDSATEGE
jgi:outer membrane lipoprotein-sorting protein